MSQKKMTPAERAKKVREMADSISVRNHLFAMVNTGRIDKDNKTRVLQFLDYIDGEVLKTCFDILPENVEPTKNPTNSDFVHAREKQQQERAATTKQAQEAAENEKRTKGVFARVQ